MTNYDDDSRQWFQYNKNSTFTVLYLYFLLRKEGKFDNKTYYKVYPSDAILSELYGVKKAHKPEKDNPMQTIVSVIGTVPYGTSKYLVEIVLPILNKNKRRAID